MSYERILCVHRDNDPIGFVVYDGSKWIASYGGRIKDMGYAGVPVQDIEAGISRVYRAHRNLLHAIEALESFVRRR